MSGVIDLVVEDETDRVIEALAGMYPTPPFEASDQSMEAYPRWCTSSGR